MAIQLSASLRDAINSAIVTAGSGAVLNLYSGPEPATTDAPLTSSNTLLASIPCGSTFGTTVNGTLTFGATGSANQVNAAAAGTATFFRVITQTQGGSSGVDLSKYTDIYFDEFNGSSLDTTKWNTVPFNGTHFNQYNNELQYYETPGQNGVNAFSAANSILTISATPTPSAQLTNFSSQAYVSGALASITHLSLTYGYIEFRMKTPTQAGIRNVVSLSAADGSWPPQILICDIRSSAPSTIYQQQVLSSVTNSNTVTTVNASTNYHVYGLSWTASALTWYIDGVQTYTVANQVTVPMYLYVEHIVGGTQAGAVPTGATWPQNLLFDYIRVYQTTPT